MKQMRTLGLAALLATVGPIGTSEGALMYQVTLDTSSLVGSSDTFAVAFQVTDGDGVLLNTLVTVTGVTLGGGSASGAPTYFNGADGFLDTGVSLMDSDFFNEFVEPFTPGAVLSFQLRVETTSPDPLGVGYPTPDSFAMSILFWPAGVPVPTLGPASEFLGIDLDGTPDAEAYRTDLAATDYDIPAPVVTGGAPIPEPGSLALLALGLAAWRVRRRPGRA